jgi:hypothetical protein
VFLAGRGAIQIAKTGIQVAGLNYQYLIMTKALTFSLLLFICSSSIAQVIAKVDKKTKEFTIAPDQKAEYSLIGYQLPSPNTKQIICFSSNENMVREESGKCQLGAYFDTEKIKVGDKILFLGYYGKTFVKLKYVTGAGNSEVFFLSTTGLVIK